MLYDALQVIYFLCLLHFDKGYTGTSDINGFDNDEMQADANGVTKIALIASTDCGSLVAAMEHMKEHEDDILKFRQTC
jgi:hypothetical protein